MSPLTVCAPSVAQQFLQQAQRLSLMDCAGLQATVSAARLQVCPCSEVTQSDKALVTINQASQSCIALALTLLRALCSCYGLA